MFSLLPSMPFGRANNRILMQHDPQYFHERMRIRLSQKCTPKDEAAVTDPVKLMGLGLPGCGSLLASHVQGVLTFCRALPQPLEDVARIAKSSTTHKRMQRYNIKTTEDYRVVSRALQYYLNLTKVEVEELCCKTGRQLDKTVKNYKDWVAPTEKLGHIDVATSRATLLTREGKSVLPPILIPTKMLGKLVTTKGDSFLRCNCDEYFKNVDCDLALRRRPPRASRLPTCLLYTSPSPRDKRQSRMPSSA